MTATIKAGPLKDRNFPLRNGAGCPGVGTARHFSRAGVQFETRPRIIVAPLSPMLTESPDAELWQRVGNLVRLGMVVIAVAGLVKATGALAQAVSFLMVLFYYLFR